MDLARNTHTQVFEIRAGGKYDNKRRSLNSSVNGCKTTEKGIETAEMC